MELLNLLHLADYMNHVLPLLKPTSSAFESFVSLNSLAVGSPLISQIRLLTMTEHITGHLKGGAAQVSEARCRIMMQSSDEWHGWSHLQIVMIHDISAHAESIHWLHPSIICALRSGSSLRTGTVRVRIETTPPRLIFAYSLRVNDYNGFNITETSHKSFSM